MQVLRKALIVTFLALGAVWTQQADAQELQDVVYLHDGSVIRGTIVEQVPGESILIQTVDGNRFRYSMEQIERMTREPRVGAGTTQVAFRSPKSPGTAGVLSFLIVGAGQAYNGEWGRGAAFFGSAVLLGGATIAALDEDDCYYYDECQTAGILALGWLTVAVWSIVDAYKGAKAINERMGTSGLELMPRSGLQVRAVPGSAPVVSVPILGWSH